MKIQRGCEQDSPIPGTWDAWEINGWKFQRCPKKLITKESCAYLYAHHFYINNHFPRGEGWLDQTSKFREALMIIDDEENRLREEEDKEGKG